MSVTAIDMSVIWWREREIRYQALNMPGSVKYCLTYVTTIWKVEL